MRLLNKKPSFGLLFTSTISNLDKYIEISEVVSENTGALRAWRQKEEFKN
jgi:hypothetical protein